MSNKPVTRGLLLGLLLCASQQAFAVQEGEQLYRQHCAKCHATDGRANTLRGWLYFAQNLSQAKWQERVSDEDILASIRRGPGAMPGYAKLLDAAQQQALLQQVRALRQP